MILGLNLRTGGIRRILGLNLWGIGDDRRDCRDTGAEPVGYRGQGEDVEKEGRTRGGRGEGEGSG